MTGLPSASVNLATGAYLGFTAVTTIMTTANQIHHGWNQVHLKESDMASQIPTAIKIPPIVRA